jgi:hypothetical protein
VSETNAGASFTSGLKPYGRQKKCTLSYRQEYACYTIRKYKGRKEVKSNYKERSEFKASNYLHYIKVFCTLISLNFDEYSSHQDNNGWLHSQEMMDRLLNPKVPCCVYKRLLQFPVLSQIYSFPKLSRSIS